MNRPKCEFCNIDAHRESYAKHLRSKQHLELEIEKSIELIISEWQFKEPIENKIEQTYNPKSSKQLAREIVKVDDKQLTKELAKKMINPSFFTDRILKIRFNITLESHHITHANSKMIKKSKLS